jgi:hypothetical protein
LIPDLNMIVLLSSAMLFGAALRGLGARMSMARGNSRQIEKPSRQASLAQQRALPKLRRMLPAQVAERVVASIRSTGCNGYALILADLENEVMLWCRANGVEAPPQATMLEALSATPGFRRQRTKLNKSSPEHAYVRSRQSCHGITNEYPMLYWIEDVQVMPVTGRVTRKGSTSYPCPTPVASVPGSVRTGISQRPGQCPEARPEPRRIAA